jgi:thiosulfate dehydrogenase [quinone] large subunit
MTTQADISGGATAGWRSDAAVAYAILRVTFGVNIGLRGVTRIANGTDVFAADLLKQFQAAVLPLAGVEAFGHILPWIESVLGLLLILGLLTRPALVIGGLMMTVLTAGTMLIQNFQTAWLQLTYAQVFFILLALRSWNVLSLDAWRLTRDATRAPQAGRERTPA